MGKQAAFLSPVRLKKKHSGKRKRLLNKVLDYLKADTFMFASLYSSRFSSLESSSSVPDGIGEHKPLEGNDKNLVDKIGDYLKSDDYLYASFVISPPRDSSGLPAETVHVSKGPIQEEMDRKRSADLLKGGTGELDEHGRKTVNVVSKDHNMDGFPHTRSPMVTRTRVRRETVKHMIYQNC